MSWTRESSFGRFGIGRRLVLMVARSAASRRTLQLRRTELAQTPIALDRAFEESREVDEFETLRATLDGLKPLNNGPETLIRIDGRRALALKLATENEQMVVHQTADHIEPQ